jgi:LDH2 family malate/lactate/ureidoglycolate dehydrogenase
MDLWIRRFRAAAPIDSTQKVLIPGDPERECQTDREKNGIPIVDAVWTDLQSIAQKFNIKL